VIGYSDIDLEQALVSVQIKQSDVVNSTACYKNSVTLCLFVFEGLFVFSGYRCWVLIW